LSRLVELLAAGRLSLPLGVGYGLEEAATALAAAAGGRAGGAVALTVS
jgi:hypothetical protein